MTRRSGSERRIQPPEFYEPVAKKSDFTKDEMQVLNEWSYGSQVTKTARTHLSMTPEEYWGVARSIFGKLRLPRQSATRGTVSHACGMAVVLGIFD